jgi:hypothetical protein
MGVAVRAVSMARMTLIVVLMLRVAGVIMSMVVAMIVIMVLTG